MPGIGCPDVIRSTMWANEEGYAGCGGAVEEPVLESLEGSAAVVDS